MRKDMADASCAVPAPAARGVFGRHCDSPEFPKDMGGDSLFAELVAIYSHILHILHDTGGALALQSSHLHFSPHDTPMMISMPAGLTAADAATEVFAITYG